MRRLGVILLALSIFCISAGAKDNRIPLTFSVEGSTSMSPIAFAHSTYVTTVGYLVDEYKVNYNHHFNGTLLAGAGYDIIPRLNISLYGGYAGIGKGERVYPLLLRGTCYVSKDKNAAGSGVTLEGGIGFARKERNDIIIRTGYCHRFALASYMSMDLGIGVQGTMTHPDEVYDRYSKYLVPKALLGKSKAVNLGLYLSVGFSF